MKKWNKIRGNTRRRGEGVRPNNNRPEEGKKLLHRKKYNKRKKEKYCTLENKRIRE